MEGYVEVEAGSIVAFCVLLQGSWKGGFLFLWDTSESGWDETSQWKRFGSGCCWLRSLAPFCELDSLVSNHVVIVVVIVLRRVFRHTLLEF